MKTIALTFISIFIFQILTAQTKAVTENGDTILVYDNGTWEKINEVKKVDEITTTVTAKVEVDEFENTKKTFTESWMRFGENNINRSISGSLIRVDNLTFFSFTYYGDLGCLSEYTSTLKVKLSNGSIIEFSQLTSTDCSSTAPTARFIPLTREELKDPNYQSILDENIELLRNYDWVSMRLQGSEYYTDITPKESRNIPNPEQFFRQHILAADKG